MCEAFSPHVESHAKGLACVSSARAEMPIVAAALLREAAVPPPVFRLGGATHVRVGGDSPAEQVQPRHQPRHPPRPSLREAPPFFTSSMSAC